MSYSYGVFFAQHYCNHVETKGAVLNIMGCEKIAGGPEHSDFLDRGDGRLGWAKTFVRPGLYLDKDNTTVGIDHNQVDFAGLAGEVASELLEALAFEEPLATFFTPSAEELAIRQQPAFVQQQTHHN